MNLSIDCTYDSGALRSVKTLSGGQVFKPPLCFSFGFGEACGDKNDKKLLFYR
jgi:hypothetical protein